MHEQLAGPVGLVVRAVALPVLRDVQADEPGLALAHLRIGVLQRRLAVAERLDFGPGQHEPGLDLVGEVVVVPRAPVVDDQLFSSGLRHGAEV